MICRHVFAVCNTTQKTDFIRLNLHEWWFNTNSLKLDSLHFKNAKNALTVSKTMPGNFFKLTKKKGRPKIENVEI